MNYIKLILILTLILDSVLFFVLFKNRKTLSVKIFLIQIFGTLGWTLCIFLNLWFSKLIIESFIFSFATIIVTAQIWFVKLWHTETFPKKITAYWSLIPGIFFALVSFYPEALFKSIAISPNGYTILVNGFLSGAYSLFIAIYIIYSIYLLYKKYKTSSSVYIKNQSYHLMCGVGIFFLVNVMTNSILPVFFNIYFFNAIGPAFSLILIGFIFYTIYKHQFLDIKIIIQKGLIYSILLSIIIAVYLGLIFTFEYIFSNKNSELIIVSALITTLLGVFGVTPLKKYFEKITDSIFFKNSYDYINVLNSLTDVLNKNISLDAIIDKSSEIIKQSLKSKEVIFCLKDKNEFPEKENYICVKIKSNKKNIGTICIGKKLSDEEYTTRDMNLLETFAKQAGVAQICISK